MTLSNTANFLLDSTIQSVKEVLPFEISVDIPSMLSQPYTQHSVGVLIGMTGDVRGRLVIDGDEHIFGKIGESMFGMTLEGELLQSFAGELGNMIGGNLSTFISRMDLDMDITPPTVLVGQTKLYGFDKAYCLPVNIQNIGSMMIIIMIE